MAAKKIEDGIRSYIDSIGVRHKPVVDRGAVKELKSKLRSEKDPIAKLRLLAALEDEQAGRVPDTDGLEAVFIANAKDWADDQGIPVSAFRALKVPDDVLREAGFLVSSTSKRSSAGTTKRAPAIPMDEVQAAAKRLGSGWKLSDLAAALDRDAPTVRNYVNKLIEASAVVVVGEDPEHEGRGRAPKIYAAK